MSKKILFFLIINIIIFVSIELSVKITLKLLGYPTVYKLGNIGDKRYDYLTGYYNLPNKKEINEKNFSQGTDKYGFNLDGLRNSSKDLTTKDDSTFRIFLLGGSTAQGRKLIDRSDPISARLEKNLNKKFASSGFNFKIINAGVTSFISSQELALIQYKILYSFKPDYILVLNGTNDAVIPLGNQHHLSNSHPYQRGFQKNLHRNYKNFLFFFDDFLSKNISTYFLTKKIIEKTTGIFLFGSDTRMLSSNKITTDIVKGKTYRYLYNVDLISKLASENTLISVFFQPQMLPNNVKNLSNNDQKIYKDFEIKNPKYFVNKQLFYKIIKKEIKLFNSSSNSKKNQYFELVDISDLLDNPLDSENYYSDHVHYTPVSRKILTNAILKSIEEKIKKKLLRQNL